MPQANLKVEVRKVTPSVAVIDLIGEVTGFAETILTEAYNQAAGGGAKTIVLNFSKLEYMNSSGIGLLVTLLIRAQRQKQNLFASGLTDHYTQIFELTRLNEAIGIFATEAEAIAAAKV